MPIASTEIIDFKHISRPARNGKLPREVQIGWLVIFAFFGVFLGFAGLVRMDAAATADGTIKVSGSRRAVQHRDGGVVSALRVHEGEHVHAGQVVIELAGAEVAANERALAGQVIGLEAERARLLAEQSGAPVISAPAPFAALIGADRALADDAIRLQRSELGARRGSVAAQKNVLLQQATQARLKAAGFDKQMAATAEQNRIFGDQLSGMRDLAAKGYASLNRVRELQRAQASLSGETASLSASGAAARQQIGESRMQALSIDSQHLQQVTDELQRNGAALNEAMPKWQAVRHQLQATKIRSPVSGQIVGLQVFTVGGVISPGQKLMEIVPDAMPLVIEPMISPKDAADLHVGQTAEIRFDSLHDRSLPIFTGTITRLSADSFTDEKTGARYFTGEVTVPPVVLRQIKEASTLNQLKPGLAAQIIVPLRKRSLLDYLIEPVCQGLWRAGREH